MRSPKSPARKKVMPLEQRHPAWAPSFVCRDDVDGTYECVRSHLAQNPHIPAPVPPRSRKGGGK